jgi:hypothetical protein
VRPCTDTEALYNRTAHRGSRVIALLFHDQWHWKRVKGQRHAPAALNPGKDPVPIVQEAGWGPQGRSGQVRKISPPRVLDLQTVQPVASRYTDYAPQPTLYILPGLNSNILYDACFALFVARISEQAATFALNVNH